MSDRAIEGDFRVWWIPQIPGRPFLVPVASIAEAKKLLDVLAKYDAFQYENKIKPDYCNTGGLSVYEDGEWLEWTDDEGNSIDEIEVTA